MEFGERLGRNAAGQRLCCSERETATVPETARARADCFDATAAGCGSAEQARPTSKLRAVEGARLLSCWFRELLLWSSGQSFWKLTRCGKRVVSECLKPLREV